MSVAAYREFSVSSGLADRVQCLWDRVEDTEAHVIMPDGCVDLIWMDNRQLVVVGADSAARSIVMVPGVRTCGIRLRLGAAGPVLQRSAADVVDRQVPAEFLWPEAALLAERLESAEPVRQLNLLAEFVAERGGSIDPLVATAAARLGRSGDRVARVAEDLGVSERHLFRRTVAAVGYGPKRLSRVMRSRRLTRVNGHSLAGLAHAAGYSSQAHMSDDIRALTGMTPVRFLEYLGREPALG